jgi:GntP family gluconate:H+ symporter
MTLAPFLALFLGIAFVVISIAVYRVHPFIALIIAAVIVGSASNLMSGVEGNAIVMAIRETMVQFGHTAGGIAWIIALAAVIGLCLMESGAADRIVRTMIRVFGEKNAGLAMLVSAFCLSIPVFFDTVFYLMVPLAQAMAFRLGRQYVYFIVAVCSGAVITHSLVPPTPGPLIVVEALGINLGLTIAGGIVLGIIPAIVALKLGAFLDGKLNIPLREGGMVKIRDLEEIVNKDTSELPGFFISLLPVMLPVFLISLSSFTQEFSGRESLGYLYDVIEILGIKHVAMFLGAIIAIYLMAKYKRMDKATLWKALESPLGMAGTIILITAAGGAFGGMIRHSGIGEAITALTEGSGISFVLLAWLIAAIMKMAQGSSTTAMITTSGIMAGILAALNAGAGSLGHDPFYIFAAIAFGAMFGSWMNDSGFWIVCKMTGFTEAETLKTWTLLVSVISVVGLFEVWLAATVAPNPFG